MPINNSTSHLPLPGVGTAHSDLIGDLASGASIAKSATSVFTKSAKAATAVHRHFSKDYPQLIAQQLDRQGALILELSGHGVAKEQLEPLVQAHQRLARLVDRQQRGAYADALGKPMLHRSAAEYAQRFVKEASRVSVGLESDTLAYRVAELRAGITDLREGNLTRLASVPHLVDTTGRSLKSIAKSGSDAVDLAHKIGLVSAEVGMQAAEVASSVTSAVTLPLTALTAVTGAMKTLGHVEQRRSWVKAEKALPFIRSAVDSAVFADLKSEIRTNRRIGTSRIAAGVGEVSAKVGAAGIAVASAAAPIVVPAAIVPTVVGLASKQAGKAVERFDKKFNGDGASELAKAVRAPQQALGELAEVDFERAVQNAVARYDAYRSDFAAHKLASLTLAVLRSEESSGKPLTAQERQDAVRRMIDPDSLFPGRKSLTKGTTARGADVARMNAMLNDQCSVARLEGTVEQVRAGVMERLTAHDRGSRTLQACRPDILKRWAAEMAGMRKTFSAVNALALDIESGPENVSDREVIILRATNPKADEAYLKVSLSVLVDQIKTDDKHLRAGELRSLVNFAHVAQTRPTNRF